MTRAVTDASGKTLFNFTAPMPAGDHRLRAICDGDPNKCTQEGPDLVWVGHKNLRSLAGSSLYNLIGQTATHPNNHYLTPTAIERVTVFSALYRAKFPALAVLHLNDASLERGGIFDLYPDSPPWVAPHLEHCRGTVVDIRANGANGALNIASRTDPMIDGVVSTAQIVGAQAIFEVPQDSSGDEIWRLRHFHTRLMGQEGTQCP